MRELENDYPDNDSWISYSDYHLSIIENDDIYNKLLKLLNNEERIVGVINSVKEVNTLCF
jgi:hypothetical protein